MYMRLSPIHSPAQHESVPCLEHAPLTLLERLDLRLDGLWTGSRYVQSSTRARVSKYAWRVCSRYVWRVCSREYASAMEEEYT